MQQEVAPERLARVGSIDLLLSVCLMPAGEALAGPLSEALGVRGALLLAFGLLSVPSLSVLAFSARSVACGGAPRPGGARLAAETASSSCSGSRGGSSLVRRRSRTA